MRGYTEVAKLTNDAYVEADSIQGHRAVLRIAGHGSYYGDWRAEYRDAAHDLSVLQAKHIPKASNDGISGAQAGVFAAALAA